MQKKKGCHSQEVVEPSNCEPESQDAFHGAQHAGNLALVYALVGEPDQAISLIYRLLSILAELLCQIFRSASRSLSFVCGGNGIRCEAIRVSRRFCGAGTEDSLLTAI